MRGSIGKMYLIVPWLQIQRNWLPHDGKVLVVDCERKFAPARLLGIAGFIQDQPHGGRKTSEPGLRRVVATPYPYVVFYEVKDDEVVIVGVRHGARDPGSMPGEGGAA